MGTFTRITGEGNFSIGPVTLEIPPESIQISRYENLQFLQFLRHEHSVKIPSGRSAVRVDIVFRLMIGEDFTDLTTLQTLIGMTRVCPFVPVTNKYLANHLPLYIENTDLSEAIVDSIPMAIFGMSLVVGGDSPELVEVSMSLLFWNPMPFTGGEAMAWTNIGVEAIRNDVDTWIKNNIGMNSPIPVLGKTFRLRWMDLKTYSELLNTYPDLKKIANTEGAKAEQIPNETQPKQIEGDYTGQLEATLQEISYNAKAISVSQVSNSNDANLTKPGSKFNIRMTQWQDKIRAAATKYGIDPDVYKRLINQESGGDPNARSNKGALGLAQLMPETARVLGVTDRLDPNQSIDAGAKLLREELTRFKGDYRLAVAAYNAGSPRVRSAGNRVPKNTETQSYVNIIMGYNLQDPNMLRNVTGEDIVETAIKDYYKTTPDVAKKAIENFWRKGVLPVDPGLRTDLIRRFGINPKTGLQENSGSAPRTSYGKIIAKTPISFINKEVIRRLNIMGWRRTSDDIRPMDPLFQFEDHPNVLEMTPIGSPETRPMQLVTGLSLSFQNRFVLMPVSGWPYPTIQHLGAFDSDIRISLAMLSDREEYPVFKELNRMVHEIDARSIRYRSSVYSGRDVFAITRIDVENRILNGLGIDYTVLTDFQAVRDPESPELIRIEIGLTENGMVDEELFGHFTYSDAIWRRSLFNWLIEKTWLNPDEQSLVPGTSTDEKTGKESGLVPWANKIWNLWITQESAYLKNKNDIEFAQGTGKSAPNNVLFEAVKTSITQRVSKNNPYGAALNPFAETKTGVPYQFVSMDIAPPTVTEAGGMEKFLTDIDIKYCQTPKKFPVPVDADYLTGTGILNWAGTAWKVLFGEVLTADPEYPSRFSGRYLDGPFSAELFKAIADLKQNPKTRPNNKEDFYEANPNHIGAIFNWLDVWNKAHLEWYKTEIIEVMLVGLSRDFPEYFDRLTNEITKITNRKTGCYRDLGLANDLDVNPYQWIDSEFGQQVSTAINNLHTTAKSYIGSVTNFAKKDLIKIVDGVADSSDWSKLTSRRREDNKDIEITPEKAIERYNNGIDRQYEAMNDQVESSLKAIKHISPVQFTVRRAFPAFKLYFIEEENGGLIKTFDQFYSYNAILDWNLIEQANKGSTLVVTVSNIFNHLDAIVISDVINMKGAAQIAVAGLQSGQQVTTSNKSGGLNNTEIGIDGRSQPLANIALKPGTKIVLKVGYNNDPRKLETLFAGQVTEVMTGDTMTIVAQGWESELFATWSSEVDNPFAGLWWRSWLSAVEEDPQGTVGTTMMMKALLRHPSCKHLGHWQIGQANPFDLYTWSFTQNQVQKDLVIADGVVAGDRSSTNIRPSSSPFFSAYGINAEVQTVDVEGRTLFAISQEMRLRHPNDIMMIRPYGNGDGTVYFGPGWGFYTATDFVDSEGLFNKRAFDDQRFIAFKTMIDKDRKILVNRVTYTPGNIQLEGLQNDVGPVEKSWRRIAAHWTSDTGVSQKPIPVRAILQDPRIMSYLFAHTGKEEHYRKRWFDLFDQSGNLPWGTPKINIRSNALVAMSIELLSPGCSDQVKRLWYDALNDARFVGIRDASDRAKWDLLPGYSPIHAAMLQHVMKMIDQEIMQTLIDIKEEAERNNSNPEVAKSLRFLNYIIKPVRRWHIVTSKNHIIANNIELNSDFANGVKFGDLILSFDPGLDDKRTRDYSNTYKTGKTVDGFVASSLLADEMRKMYRGEIIITGNPDIRPHDIVLILDHTRQIYGIVEADTVVNAMSLEYGYITTIKPNLIVEVGDCTIAHAYQAFYSALQNDIQYLNDYSGSVGKKVAHALAFLHAPRTFGNINEFTQQANQVIPGTNIGGPDTDGRYLSGGAEGIGLAAIGAGGALYIGAATTVGIVAAPILLPAAILLGGTALFMGGYSYFSFLNNSLKDQVKMHPLNITPLVKRGLPFVGGIDGTAGRTAVGQWADITMKGLRDIGKARDVVAEMTETINYYKTGREDVKNFKENKPKPID